MKYLLQIWGDERSFVDASPEDASAVVDRYRGLGEEMRAAGVLLHGEGLQPTATATSVRVRDGDAHVTDGPFAETAEQLGGFYLIECPDLDAAIDWAARLPGAVDGAIEIRPVAEYERHHE